MTIKKGIIVGYQPEKKRQRRYEQKLYENDQYATQSQENESCFHYLWLHAILLKDIHEVFDNLILLILAIDEVLQTRRKGMKRKMGHLGLNGDLNLSWVLFSISIMLSISFFCS